MKYNIIFSHPDYKKNTTQLYMSVYGYYCRMPIMQEIRVPVMNYLRWRWYDYGKSCCVVQT